MRSKHRTRARQVIACLVALAGFAGLDWGHARAEPRELDVRTLQLFAPDGGTTRRERTIGYTLPSHDPLERRGTPFTSLSYRFGPEPRLGVVRHVADTRLGWLYKARRRNVATALSLRSSVFAPDTLQRLPASLALEQTQVFMLEAITVLDLRDRVRSPRRGVYVRAGLQQAGL
jgi:hypothetical protein